MFGLTFRRSLEAVVINTAAFFLTLAAFGVFVWAFGQNPFAVFHTLYLGAFGTGISIETTLTLAAPLMLTALCTAIPARAARSASTRTTSSNSPCASSSRARSARRD